MKAWRRGKLGFNRFIINEKGNSNHGNKTKYLSYSKGKDEPYKETFECDKNTEIYYNNGIVYNAFYSITSTNLQKP